MSYTSLTACLWIGAVVVGIAVFLLNQLCNRRIGRHLEEKNSRCHSISSMRTRTTSMSSYYANLERSGAILDLERGIQLQAMKKISQSPFLAALLEEEDKL